jgi:carotene epsilon-monooxygenase
MGPSLQEQYDLDVPMDGKARKLIDAAGAGRSVTSPGWLTELGRLWGGKSVSARPRLLA